MKKESNWDDRMHELFGLPKGSRKDKVKHFFSILHPEDQERIYQLVIGLVDRTQELFDPKRIDLDLFKKGELLELTVEKDAATRTPGSPAAADTPSWGSMRSMAASLSARFYSDYHPESGGYTVFQIPISKQ